MRREQGEKKNKSRSSREKKKKEVREDEQLLVLSGTSGTFLALGARELPSKRNICQLSPPSYCTRVPPRLLHAACAFSLISESA